MNENDTLRILLKEALQACAPEQWNVTVRIMRLGRKMFERKVWGQTTLDDFCDLEAGAPLVDVEHVVSYSVNPRFLNQNDIAELFHVMRDDLLKVK